MYSGKSSLINMMTNHYNFSAITENTFTALVLCDKKTIIPDIKFDTNH